MPSSPLKRPSAGGRLRRLLASLRPPAKAGPALPVQTGFPTSLADLVVKNHGRFQNTRRRHRAAAPATEPVPQQRRELSVAQEDAAAAAAAPSPVRPKGTAAFSIRPEVLAVGGAVALALLVIWSKLLVAAATAASVALLWIESARARAASPRQGRAEEEEEEEEEVGLLRARRVSPIREAAEPSPRRSSEMDTRSEDADGSGLDPSSVTPPRTEKRRQRSLRKLLAKKLRNGARRGRATTDSRHGDESEQRPGAGEVNAGAGAGAVQTRPGPAQEDTTPPPEAEAAVDDGRCRRRRWGGALPLVAAFVPIVLVGLVAGKLPAVALTVLCGVVSSSSVDRASDPAPVPVPASGDLR